MVRQKRDAVEVDWKCNEDDDCESSFFYCDVSDGRFMPDYKGTCQIVAWPIVLIVLAVVGVVVGACVCIFCCPCCAAVAVGMGIGSCCC